MVERITVQHLYNVLARLPPDIAPHRVERSFFLASFVLNHFFGQQWIQDHVFEARRPNSILSIKDSGEENEQLIQIYRTVELAETILNLQHIDGFDQCSARMKNSYNVEPTLAEMHIGKMLYINDWNFRFVVPQGERGRDYDFDIDYYDQHVCGDATCNLVATEMIATTVTNSLVSSRNQLPSNRPGVFFVKVPQQWIENAEFEAVVDFGASEFFAKGTGRVVSVKFYGEPLSWNDGMLAQSHRFREVINPRHRFSKALDWRLFSRWGPAPALSYKMPSKWFSLATFPVPPGMTPE